MFISRELKCKRCNHVQGHIISRSADEEKDYSGEEKCEHCEAIDWERHMSVPVVRTAKLSRTYVDGGAGRPDKKVFEDIRRASQLDKQAANWNKDSTEYKEAKRESKRLRKIDK